MVVAAQIGKGLNSPVNDAVAKANATKDFVYFKLRDEELYKVPPAPIFECQGKYVVPKTVLTSDGLHYVYKTYIKKVPLGKSRACLTKNTELIESNLKRCTFDAAHKCLTTLYEAWADCVVNFYLGELYQSGYLATILCDSCMNFKLGTSGLKDLQDISYREPIDCGSECEATDSYKSCLNNCAGTKDCTSIYTKCYDTASKEFTKCKSKVSPTDQPCLDACKTTYDSDKAACVSAKDTCVANCGGDTACVLSCLDVYADCELAAVDTAKSCELACGDTANSAIDACIAAFDTATALCTSNREQCEFDEGFAKEDCILNKCEPIKIDCFDKCEAAKAQSKDGARKFSESVTNRSGAKKAATSPSSTNTAITSQRSSDSLGSNF